MRRSGLVWLSGLAIGCWKLEPATLPPGQVQFDPAIGGPEGWLVDAFELPIECPDGENSRIYVVYPEGAEADLPVAIFFHSGSFDYVVAPSANDPLAGRHYAEASRLESEWGQRRVFMALGMYPDDSPAEDHQGALPAALAEQGVAMVLPANCWGDLWHNQDGERDNDVTTDLFFRNGRAAAIMAHQVVAVPGKAEEFGIELPVDFAQDQLFLVGQGEGTRALGELITAGYGARSIIADSPTDDLSVYYGDTALYGSEIEGLDRLFPGGPGTLALGSLSAVPNYPLRNVLVHSTLDSEVPAGANAALVTRLTLMPEAWLYDAGVAKHVITAADLDVSRQAVDWMLEAEVDDSGDEL